MTMMQVETKTSIPTLLSRAVLALRRKVLALADVMVPAQFGLMHRGLSVMQAKLLYLAARHRVADQLADGPKTAAQLADKAGADPQTMHRLMRALVHFGVFSIDGDGRFSNNRLSSAMRSDAAGSMFNTIQMFGAPAVLQATAGLEETLRTGESPFERVHGMVVWDWLSLHPDDGERIAGAMTEATSRDAKVLAAGYPFGELGRVCDVAGGRGALLAAILTANPRCRGVLLDQSYVVSNASDVLVRSGVADRVECVGGSMFGDDIPAGCDGYLLKDILHDWDDGHVTTILQNVRRAAAAGARLFVIETLLEPNDADSPIAAVDVFMMTICVGGRQRSLAELDRLFNATGFQLERSIPLPTMHSIVVARAV
jgi:hypothetical protein